MKNRSIDLIWFSAKSYTFGIWATLSYVFNGKTSCLFCQMYLYLWLIVVSFTWMYVIYTSQYLKWSILNNQFSFTLVTNVFQGNTHCPISSKILMASVEVMQLIWCFSWSQRFFYQEHQKMFAYPNIFLPNQ